MKKYLSDIRLLGRAFNNTKSEMWISFQVLLAIALVLSIPMFIAEHALNPDYSFTDALTWAFVKFVEDPAEIVDPPTSTFGQVIGTMIGVVGIAIFAVPAGLIGSGFMDAINEEKRNKELEKYHRQMLKAFNAGPSKMLKRHIGTLPQDPEAWYYGCNFGFVDNNIAVSKLELKGMNLKDVLDVCSIHPEFRVKNESTAMSIEDGKSDRYMIEHFPVNRRYGFMADRQSKVTIVSTSSETEFGTGNFAYYLAKFAGFNYISREFSAVEKESFYTNNWTGSKVDGLSIKERQKNGEKIPKELARKYQAKNELREEFLEDLKSLCNKEGSWVICILNHIKNQDNPVDFHIAHSTSDGNSAVHSEREKFDALMAEFRMQLQEKMDLKMEDSSRYPLTRKGNYRNVVFKLQDDGIPCNGFTIRVATHLMEFDARMRPVQFMMAKAIHDVIEPEHRLLPEEVADMNRSKSKYGYADQQVDKYLSQIPHVEE